MAREIVMQNRAKAASNTFEGWRRSFGRRRAQGCNAQKQGVLTSVGTGAMYAMVSSACAGLRRLFARQPPSMYRGIGLGLLAYGAYSSSDAAIKAIGHSLSIYEIAFASGFLSLPLIFLIRPRGMPVVDMLRANRLWLIVLRGLTGMTAGLLGTIAFQNLPFAEAYCILFLAPSFSTVWSILFLKEKVDAWRWLSIGIGLAGVILVVRPTFDTLQWAHLAAVASAFASSWTIVLLRSLNRTEHPTAIMTYSILVGVCINGLLTLPTAQVPTLEQFGLLLLVALGSGVGQILLIGATRIVQASRIVPTQYSQIGWALVIGGVFFAEFPDEIALVGIGLVVASGLINLVTSGPKSSRVRPVAGAAIRTA
jgi:drug/metabolite transporter (DMT)-like permease